MAVAGAWRDVSLKTPARRLYAKETSVIGCEPHVDRAADIHLPDALQPQLSSGKISRFAGAVAHCCGSRLPRHRHQPVTDSASGTAV
jgi:hypothetical protein